MQTSNPYLPHARRHFKRLLSRLDRDPFSASHGCFDRTYWAWKFTDFTGSRFQEALYAMCWFHTRDEDLRGNARLHSYIESGFRYWLRLQHKDGSFDEAYPFEHSLAATAFTGFYLGEAYLLAAGMLKTDLKTELLAGFERAGDWLCRNDEHHGTLSNHLAAAAAALVVIARVTGQERFRSRADHFINRILASQSGEGWYEEYGGMDAGYQTHGTFYLARIWQLTDSSELLESLKGSAVFLQHCVHPDGTLGGEYASRNTTFYYPAGYEILAPHCPEAAAIAAFMRRSVEEQDTVGPDAIDAWNLCPLLNNYLFASDNLAHISSAPALPFIEPGERYFPQAGLWIKSTTTYYLIVGLAKGGVVKLYDKRTNALAVSDCGYWAKTEKGRTVSSQSLSAGPDAAVSDGEVRVKAPFVQVNQKLMTPWMFLAFRLFNLTMCRSRHLAYALKRILVRVLVSRKKRIEAYLERRITADDESVRVEDRLTGEASANLSEITRGELFSTIHMGSSRYYQPSDLAPSTLPSMQGGQSTFEWRADR